MRRIRDKRLSQLNKHRISGDNRGMSLVELIVVMAILVIMMGAIGYSLSMLFGAEARQAAKKTEAQLNDIKTGAMSRASESMEIRYIDVDSYFASKSDAAQAGCDRDGFYAVKKVATVQNESDIKKSYADVEYTRLSSSKVEYTIIPDGADGSKTVIDKSNGNVIEIEFDRSTGKLKDYKVNGTTVSVSNDLLLQFKCGLRTYEVEITAQTGRHELK